MHICPITTISFCQPVWSHTILPVTAAGHCAAIIVGPYVRSARRRLVDGECDAVGMFTRMQMMIPRGKEKR